MTKTKNKQQKTTQDKKYKNFIENKINEFNNNGKKTIVYFCDTFYPIIDGVIKVLDNYATRIGKNHNVVVIVPKHKNKEIVTKENYLVIGVASMFFKFVNYDLAFPEADAYLKTVLKNLRIDIIHSHSPFNMGTFASKLAKKLKVPLVTTMHSQYKQDFMKHTNNNKAITSMLVKNIAKVFNKSTEVWTMHQKCADELISYGYKGSFYFVPNATDYQIPNNPESLETCINNKYNLSSVDLEFLFVGRLVHQKNILFVVDALKIIKDNGVKFKMFFVGDGPDEADLKRHIKKLGLSKEIILVGRVENREELASYYQRSNLFLFPSVYDTSSLVQIESATYKTPSVLIKDTATANTITDKVNGFLSDNNVEAYANTIMQIISDKENMKKVGENALEQLYVSWDQVAKRVEERYAYLIQQNINKKSKIIAVQALLKNNKSSK